MVRTLDSATQAAVRDRARVIPRNFVLVTARTLDTNEDVLFGFTDFGEDVTLNIVDGISGSTVSRDFFGDHSPIVSMDPMPLRIGLEVDTTQVVLNALHPAVAEMARGHTVRNAPVQIHRAYLDPGTMLPVAAPRCRRLGFVNGAPIDTPAVAEAGGITLKIVSATRELTRTNPARRSDEQQKLRSGDRFRRYNGREIAVWWGEAKG